MKPHKPSPASTLLREKFTKPREVAVPPHPVIQAFRDRFERDGFAFESGAKIRSTLSQTVNEWLAQAQVAGRDAPIDTNPGGYEARRHRYYSTAIYVKRALSGERLVFIPPFADDLTNLFTTYLQPAGANRDYEEERRFEPLPREILDHPGLEELVELCLRASPTSIFPSAVPDLLKVGLHLISLQPENWHAAVSSPNRAHFDGEYITYIVLLERANVIRGDSLIVTRDYVDFHPDDVPESACLFRGTLKEPFDILATDDRRIGHYVYPVFAGQNGRGARTVLLVDFTPLVPQLSNERLAQE